MDTASIFLRLFWENKYYFKPLLFFYLAISFVGISFYVSFVKEKSWKIILPAGVITGIFSFIVFLNIFSYFLKGEEGIKIILTIYVLSGLFLIIKNFKKIPRITLSFSITNVFSLGIYFVISAVIVFLCSAAIYGGDIIAYWGIANSFANGNYPVHSLWQPDLLAVHHQGSFLFEGVSNMFRPARVYLPHSVYSSVVILSGFFLLWGFIAKKSKTALFSIIPALVLYSSMGAIFLYLPNAFLKFIRPEVTHPMDVWPLLITAKNRLGGASTLAELVYINHRAAALSGVILILTLIDSKLKIRSFFKPSIVAIIAIAVISSDEVYMPFLAFSIFLWFIFELMFNKNKKHIFYKFSFSGILFLLLFFIVGSALRDSLLTPARELPRFSLVFDQIATRLNSWNSAVLTTKNDFFWLLPNIYFYLILAAFCLLLYFDFFSLAMFIGTVATILAYLFTEHTYYPSNEGRFLHLIYHFLGTLIAYCLFMFIRRSKKFNSKFFAWFMLLILFLPSAVGSSVDIFVRAKKDDYKNLRGKLEERSVLSWIKKNIPDKRVFFVDGYLRDISYSYLTLEGTQDYGLFIPVSPANYKVHTPDWGSESMDIIFSLNPSPILDLQIEYIYIANNQLKYYSQARLEEVNKYLEIVFEDNSGKLYKVTRSYLDKATDLPGTLKELSQIIGNKKIYIDMHNSIDFSLRSVLTLVFKNNDVYMDHGAGTFNYIETKINYSKPSLGTKYDYLILGHRTDPKSVCNCEFTKLDWKNPAAIVYEVKN